MVVLQNRVVKEFKLEKANAMVQMVAYGGKVGMSDAETLVVKTVVGEKNNDVKRFDISSEVMDIVSKELGLSNAEAMVKMAKGEFERQILQLKNRLKYAEEGLKSLESSGDFVDIVEEFIFKCEMHECIEFTKKSDYRGLEVNSKAFVFHSIDNNKKVVIKKPKKSVSGKEPKLKIVVKIFNGEQWVKVEKRKVVLTKLAENFVEMA